MNDKVNKIKQYTVGQIFGLVLVGTLLLPIIALLFVFIICVLPFGMIYLIFSKYFEMKQNISEFKQKVSLKRDTDLNIIKLELQKEKLKTRS